MWKDIHILLLGEPKVGKTSLILALVSEEFPEDVPDRIEEITIPADVTPEKVPTYIADYCEAEQHDYQLYEEISRANVICLVYDLTDLSSLSQVRFKWLPMIREYCVHENIPPIILVGTKSDLIVDTKMHKAVPIMNEYPEIETCIECSAKTLNNVSEMFYFAQKAVLHPTGPLYSPQDGNLKTESRMALTRVFKLCDRNNDGLLCDKELNDFQIMCFKSPLADKALADVKNVVSKNCPGGVEYGGLTLNGFLFLHLLFIQRGRHETTWAVLRKFGYTDAFGIAEEYLTTENDLQPPPHSIPQLNKEGRQFLIDVFRKYDSDGDDVLTNAELKELFSVFPYDPWGSDVLSTICTNSDGEITLKGFLSQWMLTTYLDTSRTLEYLGYFGFSTLTGKNSQADAICYVENSRDYYDPSPTAPRRTIFTCKVVGAKGVGKSYFLMGLLGQSGTRKHGRKGQASVLAINEVYLKEKSDKKKKKNRDVGKGEDEPYYLLLHEINVDELKSTGDASFVCDIVCLMYDVTDPDSFQPCVEVYKQFVGAQVACIVVATKSDCKPVRQHSVLQPEQFCTTNSLPPPYPFTTYEVDASIYETIVSLASKPPATAGGAVATEEASVLGLCLKVGLAIMLASATTYGVYKYWRTGEIRFPQLTFS